MGNVGSAPKAGAAGTGGTTGAKKSAGAKKKTTTKTAAAKKAAAAKKSAAAKKAAAKKALEADSVEIVKTSKPTPLTGVTTAATPIDALGVRGEFPVGKLAEIQTPSPAGEVFRLDGGLLDALRMQVRRIKTKDGTPGYSVTFKVTGPSREAFAERLGKLGATKATWEFFAGDVKEEKGQAIIVRTSAKQAVNSSFSTHAPTGSSGKAHECLRLDGKGYRLEFMPSTGALALRGEVRIEVEGDDAAAGKALDAVIKKAGLGHAFAPTTPVALRRYAALKLLWRHDPKGLTSLLKGRKDIGEIKMETIESALKAAGVSAERLDGIRYEEVAPGHFTLMDDALVKEMKDEGLCFAYSTVTMPEHVASILRGGQKATLTRWSEGALITGMSSMTDLGSGGGVGVFSRLVVPESKDKGWNGRTYKVILKPELLGRLDIWGWDSDYYGRGWDLGDANFGTGLVKAVRAKEKSSSWATSNEIISPFGNGPQFIHRIVATNEGARKKLIEHLKKDGYTPPDGLTLEELVVLKPKIDVKLVES